jgi:hypothetical protein
MMGWVELAEIPSSKMTSDSVPVYLLEAVVVLEGC